MSTCATSELKHSSDNYRELSVVMELNYGKRYFLEISRNFTTLKMQKNIQGLISFQSLNQDDVYFSEFEMHLDF